MGENSCYDGAQNIAHVSTADCCSHLSFRRVRHRTNHALGELNDRTVCPRIRGFLPIYPRTAHGESLELYLGLGGVVDSRYKGIYAALLVISAAREAQPLYPERMHVRPLSLRPGNYGDERDDDSDDKRPLSLEL